MFVPKFSLYQNMCIRYIFSAIINECLCLGGSFFLYRVSTMDFIVNAIPLPVMPLSRMTQIDASTPAPQTQNRGRRRVRLGLLGALIPPAASAPVSTCRGPRSGLSLSHSTAAPLIYRLNAIHQRSPFVVQKQGFGLSSAPQLLESDQHPHPTSQQLQPAGTDQQPGSPR